MGEGRRESGPAASPLANNEPGSASMLERWVKSFTFSAVCFAVWGSLSILRARALARTFDSMELLWLTYNATIAVLFLVRSRPSVVSLQPVHWLVALATSFSGLFFERHSAALATSEPIANGLILVGLAGAGSSALALGRSYDFVPALRGVATGGLYGLVRHPMYVSSVLIRLGYLARHPTAFNAAVFGIMVWLYGWRALFEERIMLGDPKYRQYAGRVRYRFLPGLY